MSRPDAWAPAQYERFREERAQPFYDLMRMVKVASPQQVMLEVRFVEASRQAGRELGVQWNVFNSHLVSNIGSRKPANGEIQPNGGTLPITAPTGPTNIPIGEVAARYGTSRQSLH